MTDVSSTYVIVIFKLKVSCITSVDGINSVYCPDWPISRDFIGRLSELSGDVIGYEECHRCVSIRGKRHRSLLIDSEQLLASYKRLTDGLKLKLPENNCTTDNNK